MVLLSNDTAWDVLDTAATTSAADAAARRVILEDLRSFALTADRPELFYALALLHEQETGAPQAGAEQVDALDRGLALQPVADSNPLGLLMGDRRAQLALATKRRAHGGHSAQRRPRGPRIRATRPVAAPNLPFLKLPTWPTSRSRWRRPMP